MSASSDSTEFTAEAVERALQQLYYDPDMLQKNVAQKWLAQAQASPQAWHFCWALLSPDKVPEIQFFGASTLHNKISSHWQELSSEHRESLRSQLLTHLCHFALGPKVVLTRLCVALASLILHTLLDSWPSAVPDLLRAFQGGEGTAEADGRRPVLLEVLTVLPEELQSRKFTPGTRARIQATLAQEWTLLCPLLRELLRCEDSACSVKERALRCLPSWLALGVDLGESEGVLQDSLALLKVPELFDTAVESIVGSLSVPDWQRSVDSLVNMLPCVLELQEQLKRAVQDRDMETSHGICRVVVALGETHCRTLLEQIGHWQGFQALVGMILSCTAIPGHYPVDETSSSLTLAFWYTLQDDIMSLETEKQTFYLQLYRPVYFQLVDVLLHKARFPNQHDYAASWSSDDKEQFRTYRVDISDTLMCLYELLGPELLRKLYDKLGVLLTDATRSHSSSWQDIEALLFGFQSIADTVDVGYSDVIPGLIGLIPLISVTSVQLAETVMLTLGSLAEWLADHPVMVPSVLCIVLPALSDADLSVPAVSALKRICRECKHHLYPHANDILASSQDALVKKIHKSPQSMWLMQALGFLLSAMPDEEIPEKLLSLLSPHIRELERLADQVPSPATKCFTLHVLGLISSLFSTLDLSAHGEGPDGVKGCRFAAHSNPVVVVLQQVFPLIQTLLSKWLKDTEVVEASCAVFEKSLKTLGGDFAPLVPQLCELISQMFSAFPQASALDLVRQLLQIFDCDKEHVSSIAAVLELVTNVTVSVFQHGARDHPDVVESFMKLHAQVLKRKADLYCSEGLDIRAVFYCGILALRFPETPTLKSTCVLFVSCAAFFFLDCTETPICSREKPVASIWYLLSSSMLFFLIISNCVQTELMSRCEDVPDVRGVLQEEGLLLLQTLLEAIGIQAPRGLQEHLAEVLFSISLHCPSLLATRLRDALQPDVFTFFPLLTPERKECFCQQILREQVSKRKMRDIVKEFSLSCRGLQGTEDTADY
ncbi:importin-13 isoform X3 [Ictalurus furcatus]|uniref:importin-13 isoform X3 n=1 Tax=Ictalurus furcatus TaxID=66913 RepID=UPI002350D8EE|nr:importin-13 isoform X3 [Ictalurus furcatus]